MKAVILLSLIFSFAAFAEKWSAENEWKTNCMTCHTVGGGDKIGPDLAQVNKRRSKKWLKKYIKYPMGMMQGDPEEAEYKTADKTAAALYALYKPQMMAEQELSDKQIKDLLKHIKKLSKGKKPKGKITKLLKMKK